MTTEIQDEIREEVDARVRFGNALRKIRLRLDMTQAEFAEAAGLTSQHVSDMECYRRQPLRWNQIDRVCRTMRVKPAEFFPRLADEAQKNTEKKEI